MLGNEICESSRDVDLFGKRYCHGRIEESIEVSGE